MPRVKNGKSFSCNHWVKRVFKDNICYFKHWCSKLKKEIQLWYWQLSTILTCDRKQKFQLKRLKSVLSKFLKMRCQIPTLVLSILLRWSFFVSLLYMVTILKTKDITRILILVQLSINVFLSGSKLYWPGSHFNHYWSYSPWIYFEWQVL